MKNWKVWALAAISACIALSAVFWRGYVPLEHSYTWYVGGRVNEAISLLETDPTVYIKETQDAVRVVAAATANGILSTPEAHFVLAVQYEREGDYEAAKTVLREIIEKTGEWSWPYVELGVLLARSGQDYFEEAEQLLLKAIDLQPDWVRPYNSLSVVLRLQGRLDEAETASVKAIGLAPYDVAAHNNYANLLVVEGRYKEAEEHYLFAMDSEPTNPKPPYNLACLYSIAGDHERACDYLERAVALSESARTDAAIDPYFDPIRANSRFQEILFGPAFAPETGDAPQEGEPYTDAAGVAGMEAPSEEQTGVLETKASFEE